MRKIVQIRICVVLCIVFCFALLSSCGTPSSVGASQAATPTPRPESASDLLSASNKVMSAMNSKHQSLVMVVGTDFMASYLPSTSDPAVASQLSAKYTSESDSNGATESSQLLTIKITAGTKDISYAMKQILLGDQAYLQGNSGVWYVLDASALNDSSNNPFAMGTNSLTDTGSMSLDALTGTLTDHKIEVLTGKKLRHITSTLNKDQVINAMGSSDNAFVRSITGANVDFWIDEATKYLYKIDYKVLTDASAPVVAGQPQGFEVIANFSNFNKLVNFTVPTNPQPATNVKQVLQ